MNPSPARFCERLRIWLDDSKTWSYMIEAFVDGNHFRQEVCLGLLFDWIENQFKNGGAQ